jgi:hypothetical protein
MRNVILSASVILAVALAGVGDVIACSCELPTGTPRAQVASAKRSATALFAGTVTGIDRDTDSMTVTVRFSVERVWKGRLTSSVVVTTGLGGGDCGYRFEQGTRYVVYCNGAALTELSTSICTRTRLERDAVDDLRYLGRSKRPVAPAATPGEADQPERASGVVGYYRVDRTRPVIWSLAAYADATT